jgi:hypothetical protein
MQMPHATSLRALPGVLMILTLPMNAGAENHVGTYELTPYGAYSMGGTFDDETADVAAELDDAASFGLLFNIRESANTQWEILYSRQSTTAELTGMPSVPGDIDLDVHYLQGGGTYLGEGTVARPYLAATIGAAHFDASGDDLKSDTFFSFSLGTGLQIRPNERLGLRLEARIFGTLVQSDTDLFCLSDPGNGTAGCLVTVSGNVLWQVQAMAGVSLRF